MLIWERVINSPILGAQFHSLRSWCLQSWVKKNPASASAIKFLTTTCREIDGDQERNVFEQRVPCWFARFRVGKNNQSKWHVSNHWVIWIWESCQAYDMDDAWASALGVRYETHGAYMDSVSPLQPSLGPQGGRWSASDFRSMSWVLKILEASLQSLPTPQLMGRINI